MPSVHARANVPIIHIDAVGTPCDCAGRVMIDLYCENVLVGVAVFPTEAFYDSLGEVIATMLPESAGGWTH